MEINNIMSSKRRIKRKSCEGKVLFKTHDEALIVLKKRFKNTFERIGVYKCQFGNHYHIGHSNRKMKQYIKNKHQIF